MSKLKVPGGKLVIIKLSYSDKIERIQILGDFFIHPEDALGSIEDLLVGLPISSGRSDISGIISQFSSKNGVELIGITPDAIAEAVRMAIG